MVAQWTAIGAIIAAVAAAVIVCVRIGLTAFGNLGEVQPTWSNVLTEVIKESGAGETSAVVTAIAIAAGVAIAWYKLDIFRELDPHLTITQSVESRSIGDSYALVVVTATLTNSSKVQVLPRRGVLPTVPDITSR